MMEGRKEGNNEGRKEGREGGREEGGELAEPPKLLAKAAPIMMPLPKDLIFSCVVVAAASAEPVGICQYETFSQ
jgi:hypothetical protein